MAVPVLFRLLCVLTCCKKRVRVNVLQIERTAERASCAATAYRNSILKSQTNTYKTWHVGRAGHRHELGGGFSLSGNIFVMPIVLGKASSSWGAGTGEDVITNSIENKNQPSNWDIPIRNHEEKQKRTRDFINAKNLFSNRIPRPVFFLFIASWIACDQSGK